MDGWMDGRTDDNLGPSIFIVLIYEPARHGPVTRVAPLPPALYRLLPRKSKNLDVIEKKIINSKSSKNAA